MNWLATHEYLATWLALPVAIAAILIQNIPTRFDHFDWTRTLLYLAFLTSLAVVFTPSFDLTARTSANMLLFSLLGFLVIDRKPRQ
jgi:predicted membrane channel-forming protein YqfA (hemolysin III family)